MRRNQIQNKKQLQITSCYSTNNTQYHNPVPINSGVACILTATMDAEKRDMAKMSRDSFKSPPVCYSSSSCDVGVKVRRHVVFFLGGRESWLLLLLWQTNHLGSFVLISAQSLHIGDSAIWRSPSTYGWGERDFTPSLLRSYLVFASGCSQDEDWTGNIWIAAYWTIYIMET